MLKAKGKKRGGGKEKKKLHTYIISYIASFKDKITFIRFTCRLAHSTVACKAHSAYLDSSYQKDYKWAYAKEASRLQESDTGRASDPKEI